MYVLSHPTPPRPLQMNKSNSNKEIVGTEFYDRIGRKNYF